MSRLLENDRLMTICKLGQGNDCCRYITAGRDGITCAKHTEFREIIDERVAAGVFTAISDNCDGLQD